MRYTRILAVIVLPLILISFLWSQDLTEAAKKEKERREAIKNKKVTVVTNAELGAVKKKPSVTVENPDQPAEPEANPSDQTEPANPNAANPAGESADRNEPSTAADNVPKIIPEVDTSAKATATPMQTQTQESQKSTLETKWLKAKEYADLLELKMNGLWQDFYNMDDMTPKDQIQQQIAETFDKYQQARDVEAKAKEALDKSLGGVKKD